MADSSVTLIGNATRDPELRFSNAGMPITKFGLAVNFRRQNRQTGDWDEETSFFDVVAFQQLAENVSESIRKGARVIVTGRIAVRPWEGKDGEKRTSVEVIADEIGPSLRWATAEVVKTERRGGDSNRGGGGGGGSAPAASYPDDEEPF